MPTPTPQDFRDVLTVRIGNGKTEWMVDSTSTWEGAAYLLLSSTHMNKLGRVNLRYVEGAELARLTVVTRKPLAEVSTEGV